MSSDIGRFIQPLAGCRRSVCSRAWTHSMSDYVRAAAVPWASAWQRQTWAKHDDDASHAGSDLCWTPKYPRGAGGAAGTWSARGAYTARRVWRVYLEFARVGRPPLACLSPRTWGPRARRLGLD